MLNRLINDLGSTYRCMAESIAIRLENVPQKLKHIKEEVTQSISSLKSYLAAIKNFEPLLNNDGLVSELINRQVAITSCYIISHLGCLIGCSFVRTLIRFVLPSKFILLFVAMILLPQLSNLMLKKIYMDDKNKFLFIVYSTSVNKALLAAGWSTNQTDFYPILLTLSPSMALYLYVCFSDKDTISRLKLYYFSIIPAFIVYNLMCIAFKVFAVRVLATAIAMCFASFMDMQLRIGALLQTGMGVKSSTINSLTIYTNLVFLTRIIFWIFNSNIFNLSVSY